MTKKGERYRNLYSGRVVTLATIESVRVGPGERHRDVVVLTTGERWEAGEAHWPSPQFHACHELLK